MAKDWKAGERMVGTRLGGERVPINGRARGSAPDVKHLDLGLEVKTRKAIPGWLKEGMEQAVASAGKRLPIVIVHEDRSSWDSALVFVRLADFQARFMVDGRLR